MRKFQWVTAAALAMVQSVAAFGETPSTPGPDVEQLTGGNGSDASVRPGLRLLPHLRLRVDTIGLRGGTTRNDDLTGARFRKLHMTSTIDYYPVAGFHISAGFRSWKSKLPRSLAGGGAGRLNMQSIAPTLPMRSTHANLSPLATIGYQSKIASNALFGIEAGVMSEHGRNRIAGLPANGGASQSWSKTGAVAQASVKMRFF